MDVLDGDDDQPFLGQTNNGGGFGKEFLLWLWKKNYNYTEQEEESFQQE